VILSLGLLPPCSGSVIIGMGERQQKKRRGEGEEERIPLFSFHHLSYGLTNLITADSGSRRMGERRRKRRGGWHSLFVCTYSFSRPERKARGGGRGKRKASFRLPTLAMR